MLCCRNVALRSTVLVRGKNGVLRSFKDVSSFNLSTKVTTRNVSFSAMEKAVGQYAATTFIESMNLDSRSIVSPLFLLMKFSNGTSQNSYCILCFQDTPLISVGDPANLRSWEWSSCLDRYGLQGHFVQYSPSYVPYLSRSNLLRSYPRRTVADLQAASKSAVDPFQLVEKDVSTLSGGIKDLLGSDHPVLESCAK